VRGFVRVECFKVVICDAGDLVTSHFLYQMVPGRLELWTDDLMNYRYRVDLSISK